MDILITGAIGILGRYLLPKLLGKGHIYALYQGSHPDIPEISWLRGDITQPKVDAICHLAASVNLGSSQGEGAETGSKHQCSFYSN